MFLNYLFYTVNNIKLNFKVKVGPNMCTFEKPGRNLEDLEKIRKN